MTMMLAKRTRGLSGEMSVINEVSILSKSSRRTSLCSGRRRHLTKIVVLTFLSLLTFPPSFVNGDNQYNYNYNNNNNGGDDYQPYNGDDDANKQQNYRNDDYYVRNKQYYMDDDKSNDDAYKKEQQQYQNKDDDIFYWDANVGFSGVSVMPVSCVNYNNGHMIKFQLFDSAQSYQCHFAEIATFVVSIAHYMRAYFNYQALRDGQDFQLPDDAAYLNCMQIKGNGYSDIPLYAKIGCMERETFTSTKLQLHVYTDAQCSQPYNDGQTARQHANRGYLIGDYVLDSRVSFRPPFYSCLTCAPEEVSGTFNKFNGNWYDDDYIVQNGNKQVQDGQEQEEDVQGDDYYKDDYFDDKYMAANDDVKNDDGGNNRRQLSASEQDLRAYHDEFWKEINELKIHRSLYDNYYDVGDWNMCQRIYKYGMWCDEDCRSLDFFRTDQWSSSDIFLLVIMCVFMSAMMLLIVAKRLKAQQKARLYGEEQPLPGLPPCAMLIIFVVIVVIIVTLAKLKFINETLVFAVVTCILLFIYMLKLTLFENRRPVLLAAPRHEKMFTENPLDQRLFD